MHMSIDNLFFFFKCHATLWIWGRTSKEIYQTYTLMFFTVSLSRKSIADQYSATTIKHCTKLGLNFRLIIMLILCDPYLCIMFTLTSLTNNLQSKNSTHSQWFVIKDAKLSTKPLQMQNHTWQTWQNCVSVTNMLHLTSNGKVKESKNTCHLGKETYWCWRIAWTCY